VIDASADWCALCHEIENAVFKKPEGIAAMQNVVAMSIDQSAGVDPKYVEMTNKTFNIKGLPHVEFFKPGGKSVAVVTGFDQLDNTNKLKSYLALATQR
jgi:thiol:disulfide interchange protein DsbD